MTPPPAAATAAARAPARTTRPAPRPRRVSGPVRPARRPVAVPRPARRHLPAGARALDRVRALPDHRLLDRLIGGRLWIGLIGTLLVGIVTLQLSLLKLNAGIGRAVERSAALEQVNATLRAEISRESDPQRILDQAALEGFVMPTQGTPRFITATAGDARRALVVMRVPQQSASTTLAVTMPVTPVTGTTTTTDPAATTAAPTAAPGTMTAVPSTTTTPAATAPAPTTPAAPTGAATTAGTTVAGGGAAAPQG